MEVSFYVGSSQILIWSVKGLFVFCNSKMAFVYSYEKEGVHVCEFMFSVVHIKVIFLLKLCKKINIIERLLLYFHGVFHPF